MRNEIESIVLYICFFFDSTLYKRSQPSSAKWRIISVTKYQPSNPMIHSLKPTIRHIKVSSISFPFFFAPSLHHTLCLPDSLDSLSDADVIGLKLVQADANSDSRQVQTPPEELSQARVGSRRDVVNDDGLEADVGVQQDGRAQDGVGGGVERTGGKGRNGERHEAGGEEALKGPVV